MALNSNGMVQNVKASIEKYIHTHLVMTEGFTLSFEGMQFEPASMSEWIQERILSFTEEEYHRQVSNTEEGQTTMVMLSFNVFVNPDKADRTNRHYEIRDRIEEYFNIGDSISLYDFNNDDFANALQTMKIRDVITDTAIPNDSWMQYNYTCLVSFLEKW
jgi:hypothetical protein